MRSVSTVQQVESASRRTAGVPQWETSYGDFSAGAQAFIDAYRLHGYGRALINPLESVSRDPFPLAELDPTTYGLRFDETAAYSVRFGNASYTLTLTELLSYLQATYCGSVSLESAHVRSVEQRRWLYAQMESKIESPTAIDRDAHQILARLAAAEAFEHFHRAHCATYKQFSLEGSESFVVLLRTAVETAARHGVEDLVLGMPHRGRLNLMLNSLGVPAKQLMSLFSSNPEPSLAGADIKDHAGFSRRIDTPNGSIRVLLARNPSHLESVSPVVCGMTRALQDRKTIGSTHRVMPVLVHGDGSFCGQGIVTETLNLSQTRGYSVGGTLHLILNNQIGSTVSHPRDARSTLYGADIARGIDAPVLHVNADDPDAVVFAARIATEFRMKFGSDIVIDQVGYRRYGHFTGDDPTLTQPAMQRRIQRHRTVSDLYAEKLMQRGLAGTDTLECLKTEALAMMTEAREESNRPAPAAVSPEAGRLETTERRVHTAVPQGQLRAMIERLAAAPAAIKLHPRVDQMRQEWLAVAKDTDAPVDWRLAENLAYGTLLANGFNIRLSGLDVGRGTFMHRQHVWHDQSNDADWQRLHVPLRHVADTQGAFSIFESPLSEEAVLGFEYGYALQCGRDLVVWEAQFGDFVNNAQVIIDQYIASGESKWGYENGLVLMLPHGYDGWGPEHSCAYLGRFLHLCAGGNMRVAMPSTAAQSYHLLRRQALMGERKPLVVMTPKPWLYGCAESHSRLAGLASDGFKTVIAERDGIDPAAVVRAIVTSGKVYYDLAAARAKAGRRNVPVLRVEELYPFPVHTLRDELARFPALREVVWAQEEAKNHGAWHIIRDLLEATLPPGVSLCYAGRPAAAATAVCSAAQHTAQREQLVAEALALPPN